MRQVARCCHFRQVPVTVYIARVVLFSTLAAYAQRHPVYHCNDNCQSLSSLGALAGWTSC